MNTLQTAQENAELKTSILDAWDKFVRSMPIDRMGPKLNEIVLAVIGCCNDVGDPPEKALAIISYLIVDSQSALSPHFKSIFGVPTSLPFIKIRQVIDRAKGSNLSIQKELGMVISVLSHESPRVVYEALGHLCPLLRERRSETHQLVLQEAVDPIISKLIDALLSINRRFSNGKVIVEAQVLKLCMECFGALGAIDPDRIEEMPRPKQEQIQLVDDFTSYETFVPFCCRLIHRRLFGAFRAAKDTKHQDRVAFVIQELLAVCHFSEDALKASGAQAEFLKSHWSNFPRDVQDAIRPLLSSKYSINVPAAKPWTGSIYMQKTTYQAWLQSWTVDLIDGIGNSDALRIFGPCRAVIRGGELSVMTWLLPQLLLTTILSGDRKRREQAFDEVMSVLTHADQQDAQQKNHLSSQVSTYVS